LGELTPSHCVRSDGGSETFEMAETMHISSASRIKICHGEDRVGEAFCCERRCCRLGTCDTFEAGMLTSRTDKAFTASNASNQSEIFSPSGEGY
jgi:hypothetical protein